MKPGEMTFERTLRAAQGYTELGMVDDALAELDAVEPRYGKRIELLQMRLLVLMRARRWTEGLGVSRELCRRDPHSIVGALHAAFCLHELGRTAEAKMTLMAGPPGLQREPTYYYNLGCYDAVLGNLQAARAHLRTSFELDKNFRELAKMDPDLKLIWEML